MFQRAPLLLSLLLVACATPKSGFDEVYDILPELGHRNWIAVVDMAYPAQIAPGIGTLYVGGEQLEAVRKVLDAVDASPHVAAEVFLDAELTAVPEADAPGIDAYRASLDAVLTGRDPERLPHEDIIAMLDEAADTFRVLVVKTDMALPYTSVFLRLDCGYWDGDAEQRMRDAQR